MWTLEPAQLETIITATQSCRLQEIIILDRFSESEVSDVGADRVVAQGVAFYGDQRAGQLLHVTLVLPGLGATVGHHFTTISTPGLRHDGAEEPMKREVQDGLSLALEGVCDLSFYVLNADLSRARTTPRPRLRKRCLRWPRRYQNRRASSRTCSSEDDA